MLPSKTAVGETDFRAERDRFVAFAFAGAELLIEVGSDERILYVAGASRALTGRDAGSLVGALFCEVFSAAKRDLLRNLLQKLRRQKRMAPLPLSLDRGGKSALEIILNGCCLPERNDKFYFTIALRPGSPEVAAEKARDRDTGLLDRSGFQTAAVAALNGADGSQRDVAMTLLDVGGIEDLRARSGDGAVSRLLSEIGVFLAAHAVDGASGRIGPDRFGVVQDAAQTADLSKEIERLSLAHDRAGRGLSVKEQTVQLAVNDLTPADVEKALAYTLGRFAEAGGEALSIRSLADGFRELVTETVGRIGHFRSSVEDRLAIVYQPVVELTSARVHHYEALSRFEGDRSPADMIQFAEGVGMIEELDLTVCQRVLRFLDAARDNPQLRLAVNLSARSLRSDVFVSALAHLLHSRSDHERLLFEITETIEIVDLPRANRVIQDLRGTGHAVCLDDFGAGAASFPYLQALTVDFVKIDGAYIRRMLDAVRDHTILKAMVRLCRDLGTATIAEMVETQAQRQRLSDLGVQFGQGFLFGRPAAAPSGHATGTTAPGLETSLAHRTRKMPPPKSTARRIGIARSSG